MAQLTTCLHELNTLHHDCKAWNHCRICGICESNEKEDWVPDAVGIEAGEYESMRDANFPFPNMLSNASSVEAV